MISRNLLQPRLCLQNEVMYKALLLKVTYKKVLKRFINKHQLYMVKNKGFKETSYLYGCCQKVILPNGFFLYAETKNS